MSGYYKKTQFWEKVKDSIHVVGALTQMGLITADSAHVWNYVTGIGQLAGMMIAIWFADKNKDGTVDIFEQEVTVNISSKTPIDVDVTKTKTDQP